MADPNTKVRQMLIDGYSTAPKLLEYKLYQVFKILSNQEQVAVHNDILDDVKLMVGVGIKDLVEKVAQEIINVGKAEMLKEKE